MRRGHARGTSTSLGNEECDLSCSQGIYTSAQSRGSILAEVFSSAVGDTKGRYIPCQHSGNAAALVTLPLVQNCQGHPNRGGASRTAAAVVLPKNGLLNPPGKLSETARLRAGLYRYHCQTPHVLWICILLWKLLCFSFTLVNNSWKLNEQFKMTI